VATKTLTTLQKSWANTRAVRSGHFAAFYPGGAGQGKDNTLVLFDPSGKEVAKNTDPIRDFDLAIDETTGEIFAIYCQFVDGDARPIRRWDTGVRVPVAAAPPQPGTGATINGPTKAALLAKLAEAQQLAEAIA
jgi:hypothetical protein